MPEAPTTIMLIDDEHHNLNLLVDSLRDQGWEVRAFPAGALGLAAAREDPPDLLLLDIRMPGMDGYEVCRRFKADPLLQTVPILFISAHPAAASIAAGFEAGGVDYIAKPFHLSEEIGRAHV